MSPTSSPRRQWSRADIVAALRRWHRLYGAAPAAGEWNPSMAKRQGHAERVHRFYSGRWPNYRTVLKHFDSWNDAVRGAGLEPRPRGGRPGQSRDSVLAAMKGVDTAAIPGVSR